MSPGSRQISTISLNAFTDFPMNTHETSALHFTKEYVRIYPVSPLLITIYHQYWNINQLSIDYVLGTSS